MNRRHILRQSTLLGAASLLPAASVLGSTAEPIASGFSSGLSYSKRTHQDLLPDGTVRVVVSVDDLSAYQQSDIHGELSRVADADLEVKAEGNLLCFSHRNTSYQIEHVLPGQFRKAIS